MRSLSRSLLDLAPRRAAVAALVSLVSLGACADGSATSPDAARGLAAGGAPSLAANDVGEHGAGAVFVSSNAADGNAVVAFRRAADGALSPLGTFATGGRGIGGTADPLASQFALTLSGDNTLLFVVNAGSNDVSVFRVSDDGLQLVDRKPSGGIRPVSVAAGAHTLYVLNAGDNTIGGFRIAHDGTLSPLGVHTLSAGAAGASTIRLSRDGRTLAVTERESNSIDGFAVASDGRLGAPTLAPSSGAVPFGFDFTNRGQLIVSEAGSAATSSYAQGRDGVVRPLDGPVSTEGQAAPCWVIVDRAGRFAYVANSGSGSISGYAIAADGALTLLTPGGVTGDLGAGTQPLDLDLSRGSRFLYVLENGTGAIGSFAVRPDGTLGALTTTPGLAAGAGFMGLAAY